MRVWFWEMEIEESRWFKGQMLVEEWIESWQSLVTGKGDVWKRRNERQLHLKLRRLEEQLAFDRNRSEAQRKESRNKGKLDDFNFTLVYYY